MNADQWGVSLGYVDTDGVSHEAPAETRAAIRQALGAPDDPTIAPADDGAIVVSQGDDWTLHSEGDLILEDGSSQHVSAGWTPGHTPDLPLGYHRIHIAGQDHSRAFIHAPASCALPDDLRGWGWAVQLYACRSYESWGIGDLADLRTLNQWSKERGARYTLVNPLHAATPTPGQQPSPYFPTSRVWRNPLYIRIDEVPGFHQVASELATVEGAALAMLDVRHIDRDTVRRHKMAALERIWVDWVMPKSTIGDATRDEFTGWRAGHGKTLEHFALYCALVEVHGGDIREWPAALSHAGAAGTSVAAETYANRVSFHAWLQWLIERQLSAANSVLPVMTDLAIGVDRAGADAWVWPDAFSTTMSVGAPPDTFNTQGQNWGLPPFDPWKLRRAGYEPFIQTVRSAFRAAGAVRMDHIMGLFRLWWIPEGKDPKDGCYVYLPFRDLTGILALESHRAGLGVVGEDLGTIEPYVSAELAIRKVLSYKLVQFEPGPTAELPEDAMTAITTHDLPTLAGAYTGSDLIEAAAIGSRPNALGAAEVRASLMRKAGLAPALEDDTDDLFAPLIASDRKFVDDFLASGRAANETEVERLLGISDHLSVAHTPKVRALIDAAHVDLATSGSRLVSVTLDDGLGVEERPNIPGTIDERPNWRIALPSPLEVILTHPGVERAASAMKSRAVNSRASDNQAGERTKDGQP
jgi:4-alpha-glucanotransferase